MSEGTPALGFVGILAPGSILGEAIFGFSKAPKHATGLLVAVLRDLMVSDPDIVEDLFDMPVEQVSANLEAAVAEAKGLLGGSSASAERLTAEVLALLANLQGGLDFMLPQSAPPPALLEKLAELLLNPSYVPGEPCLAAPPLLRDLLDVALGRTIGGLGATVAKVGQTVWDFLLPAFGEEQLLAQSIQSILADPVTAALNWILGKRDQIDCPVEASLGVGAGVIQDQIRHIEEALAGALA